MDKGISPVTASDTLSMAVDHRDVTGTAGNGTGSPGMTESGTQAGPHVSVSATYKGQGRQTFNCPIFDPKTHTYELWKDSVKVWRTVCHLPHSEQGAAIYLSLQGAAKVHVNLMDKDLLNSYDSFEEVIKVLDELYLPQQFEREQAQFHELWDCTRKDDESIVGFVTEFNSRLLSYEALAGKIPTKLSAHWLLEAAKLTKAQKDVDQVTPGN